MEIDNHIQYFERAVLNYYRTNSHLYHLKEDDMGGEIRVSDNWNEDIEKNFPYIELPFGFRKLENNFICIAIFMPSFIDRVSEKDYSKWMGFHLKNPIFSKSDSAFERWTERYLNGSWEVESGPKVKIEHELKLINSLTKTKFEKQLFKHDEYRLLNYPVAENNEEYTKSILELYRLVIDSMDGNCIIDIANYINIRLTNDKKRLNSLKEIIPEQFKDIIYSPFCRINRQRMPIHGIPSKGIVAFPAFDTFNSELKLLLRGLKKMKEWLESVFNINAESSLRRIGSLSSFPKITNPPMPRSKASAANKMIGKTIEKIEFGEYNPCKEAHKGEALNIYFSDGSAVSLQIGSNAANISYDHDEIKPSDFHTDIMLFWAEKLSQNSKD